MTRKADLFCAEAARRIPISGGAMGAGWSWHARRAHKKKGRASLPGLLAIGDAAQRR